MDVVNDFEAIVRLGVGECARVFEYIYRLLRTGLQKGSMSPGWVGLDDHHGIRDSEGTSRIIMIHDHDHQCPLRFTCPPGSLRISEASLASGSG